MNIWGFDYIVMIIAAKWLEVKAGGVNLYHGYSIIPSCFQSREPP
jgi:hypothetical protein